MNNWKSVWNKKHFEYESGSDNIEDLFIKMKIADGYDALGECKITFDDFLKQFKEMLWYLQNCEQGTKISSAFEVCCGCAPNLLLFQEMGIKEVGGIDYSKGLIEGARKYIHTNDLTVGEAIHLPISPMYDTVFCKGGVSYFESLDYVKCVLDLMIKKARFSVGILDVFEESKKKIFIESRRKNIENYDEKYKGLDKLFISREFFINYAKQNQLNIRFAETHLIGYWNSDYTFNVYLYK